MKDKQIIEKWVEDNINYFDPDDCDFKYEIDQAIDDMLDSYAQDFDIETEEFEEKELLIKCFTDHWHEIY